jgi:hypothetical protein
MNADELDGAPNLDRFIFTLFNRLNGYVAKPPLFRRAPVPVLQEGIVSFTQALHCYGTRVDGLAHSPSVLAYFEGTYLTEVDAWVTQRLTPQGPQPTRPRTGSIMLGTSRGQAPVPQPPTRRRGNSLI